MSLVVPNDFKKKEAREIIEKKRHKGKALINRKEKEKTIYISKVLWPIRYFELNYEVPRIFFPKKTRKISKKLFMLGFFSHSVVKETLRRKNGKKALKLIFSRAKRHILNSLKKYRSITPKLPIYDPNTIFRELTACYITKVEELEKNIDVTKQRIKPFLQNAEELEKKATELQKKIQSLNSRNTHDKKNLKKEMIAQKRSLKKKAKTIRKKARKELKPLERNLKRYKNKWKRGKKRFLKLKSNAKNITFKIINSYFY
ncbi:MAG: hypothetical protein U9O98_02680, partial [Asgard group archaeon]|nr:hypothetical protein [Asgard group archaeon]